MLNGDVLTDIDLTAQIAQHERTGARGTLALVAGRGPDRLRPRAPATTTARSREFVEKPSRRPDRHEPHQRRRLRARARGARPDRRPTATSRSSARSARGSSATASTASPAEAYWLDIGTPERYLQGTFDILEGNVAHARSPSASDDGYLAVGERRRGRPGASSRRRWSSAAARSPRARTSAASPCSAAGVKVGAGTTIERAVVLERRRDRRELHAARLHRRRRARASATARTSSGGAVLGEGVTRRRRATSLAARRARCSPDVDAPRRRDHVLRRERRPTEQLDSTASAIAAGRLRRPARRRARACPSTCATRCGRSSRRGLEPLGQRPAAWSSPAWAARRSAARSRARSSATTPRARSAGARDYGAARLDDARHDRAVRQLLRRHRGDARLLRGGRRARRAPRRRRPPAASSPSSRAPTACR